MSSRLLLTLVPSEFEVDCLLSVFQQVLGTLWQHKFGAFFFLLVDRHLHTIEYIF